MAENILELKHITKLYPGVTALDDVSLSFLPGEVHAIVGENGAGKSTLIKTISGAIEPTSGEIILNGKHFDYLTPAQSKDEGIAVVYQEFTLVPVLTAAENMFMGSFITHGAVCDQKEMRARAKETFDRMGIDLDPGVLVGDLTTGYQQLVEIAKAVIKDAKILILDEPSAPLTVNEVDAMFRVVETLKQQGVTVIYISHRMEEIFQVADRVSVLRDGQYISTQNVAETNRDDLIKQMVGRTLKETYPEHNYATDEVVLEVKNLSGNGVKDISFQLHRGEILGFAGLVGAGRTELFQVIFGNEKVDSGEIYLHGKKVDLKVPKQAVDAGISLVPEDRKTQGVILEMSVKDNLILPTLQRNSRFGVVDRSKEQEVADKAISSLAIKTPTIHQLAKNLSGGNQQKLVLGKWLAAGSDILIMDEPTRGIDVGAKHEIYEIMVDLVKQGKSIIMISSEMEEIIGMSDRMVVLYQGRYQGILEKGEFDQETILKKAAGE